MSESAIHYCSARSYRHYHKLLPNGGSTYMRNYYICGFYVYICMFDRDDLVTSNFVHQLSTRFVHKMLPSPV